MFEHWQKGRRGAGRKIGAGLEKIGAGLAEGANERTNARKHEGPGGMMAREMSDGYLAQSDAGALQIS